MNDTEQVVVQEKQVLDNTSEFPTFAKAMKAYLLYYPKLSTVDIGKMLGVR